MSEQGITLLETVLSIVILSLVTVTLLPAVNNLQERLHNEKLAYRASEAAYNGAKEAAYAGAVKGMITIDDTEYNWQYSSGEICVTYSDLRGQQKMCIDLEGKSEGLHL